MTALAAGGRQERQRTIGRARTATAVSKWRTQEAAGPSKTDKATWKTAAAEEEAEAEGGDASNAVGQISDVCFWLSEFES